MGAGEPPHTMPQDLEDESRPPSQAAPAPSPIPAPGARRRLRLPAWCFGDVGWLFAGRAIRSFSQAFLVVVVPLYIAAAGYSTMRVGYMLSVAAAGSAAFVLLIGIYADRYGRRRIMLGLAVLSILGAAAYALTAEFWVLAAAGALASVGRGGSAGSGGAMGPFYPAEQAMVAGATRPQDRNTAFGALSFVGVLAGAAGSLVAALPQLAHDGWHLPWLAAYRIVFWIGAAVGVALVLVILPLHESLGQPRAPGKGAAGAPAAPRLLSRDMLRLVGKLWLTNGLNGLAFGLFGPFLTYWLYLRFGVGPAALAGLYTIVNLASALPYLGAAGLARRLGAVVTVVLTRVVSVAFFVGMVVAPTWPLASLFYLLRVVVGSLGNPVRQSFVMGVSEERSRSTVAAFGNLPSQLTSAVAPSLGAYLMTAVSFEAPLLLAAGVQLLNAGTFLLAFRGTRPPEEQGAGEAPVRP